MKSPTRRVRNARGHLNRDMIVVAATAIATAEGIEQISIRKIADRLNAAPMSIYQHFEGKQEIENVVAMGLLGELIHVQAPDPDEPWEVTLRTVAGKILAALVEHPSLLRLFSYKASHEARETLLLQEQIHALFTRCGLPPGEQRTMLRLLASFLIGAAFSSLNTQDAAASHLDEMLSAAAIVETRDSSDYPFLRQALQATQRPQPTSFDACIDLFIEILRQRAHGA